MHPPFSGDLWQVQPDAISFSALITGAGRSRKGGWRLALQAALQAADAAAAEGGDLLLWSAAISACEKGGERGGTCWGSWGLLIEFFLNMGLAQKVSPWKPHFLFVFPFIKGFLGTLL